MAGSFTHLHQHTEYSMLDGASRVRDVVAAAVADGQPAIGITDHGVMYGVLDFYKECNDQGIKPILGIELYQAADSRHERPRRTSAKQDDGGGDAEGGNKLYYHLTALAETTQGYRNLIKLSSEAFLSGYFYKPRCDWELLEQHHEGIIATTGCLGGVVLQALLHDDEALAVDRAARLQDIFGKDNLFVELQDHGIPEQRRTNPQLLRIAKRIGAPLLATNDSHYVHRHDAVAHDALLCVQTAALMADEKRFRFHGDEHYLKSAAEMRSLFADLPEACDSTLWIAERADVQIEFGNPQLPQFELPHGFSTQGEYLRHLVYEGARERYGEVLGDNVTKRIDYELGVIEDMGFSAYFLVVWDLIKYARDSGFRVGPGRGSAAGSCVSYCLKIVDLDPIRYDLLFERFLNPGRKSMPDIDMDFDSRYRGEMIRYAAEKYGYDHVAQIITFSTIKARAAARDAARVLGYPYSVGDRVAKAMPPLVMGRDTPLWACFDPHDKYKDGYKAAAELRSMYDADPDVKKVVDVARGLEGLRRGDSIHAAAVVITNEPLTEYLPIQRKPDANTPIEEAPIVTQYEMGTVEELGLLKMDFLGLRNLDVIDMTVEMVDRSAGHKPDIDRVPLDDQRTYDLLAKGDSIGVFQLEGGPMRQLMRALAPSSFDDVAALVALYRPGPMAANMHYDYADRKNGRKPITYLHEDMGKVLGETWGLCVAGDTEVIEARSGRRVQIKDVDPDQEGGFWIQGVDADFQPAVRQVTHWVCNGEKDVVRMRLANGMELTATPDHQVLTERGWVAIGDLTFDDHVAVPGELVAGRATGEVDFDRLLIAGYLIADGGLSVKTAITFVNEDEVLCEAFASAIERAFPGHHINRLVGPRNVKRLTVTSGSGGGGGAGELLRWLRATGLKHEIGSERGGPRSDEKRVPAWVFEQPDLGLAAFLAALWDCDGHVGDKVAHYKTISRLLAKDVQLLLMRLGIPSSVTRSEYVRPKDGRTMTAYQVSTSDGEGFGGIVQPLLRSDRKRERVITARTRGTTLSRGEIRERLISSGRGELGRACADAGLQRARFDPGVVKRNPRVHITTVGQLLVNELVLESLIPRTAVLWSAVREVVPAGECQVFDISVDSIHNFVANGFVIHNCIFQEQLMRLAQVFAGYSLEEADNLRRAAGKKKREIMAKEKVPFVAGCVSNGYEESLANQLFEMIEPFADYGFNKSHSYGYGFVAYQTAWLKANYPVQYLACLLTSVKDDKDKTAVYLSECRQMGIEVAVPDVNVSASDFEALIDTDTLGQPWLGGAGRIPFGLSAIRNVGEGVTSLIVEAREKGGPFTDFYDFCQRVDPMALNKRTVESLIKAGAFDALGHPRKGLLEVYEQIVDRTIAQRREADQGIMSLFGDLDGGGASFDDARIPIRDVDFDKKERLAYEKEMLGLYLSDHPLLGAEAALRRATDCTITDLRESTANDVEGVPASGFERGGRSEARWVGGVITSLTRKYTKKGELMATFVLEDLQAAIPVMVFPRTMQEVGHLLADDVVVCVRGRLDTREDEPSLICQEVRVPDLVLDGGPPLRVKVPAAALNEGNVTRLKALLSEHPGDSPVFLHVGTKVLRLDQSFAADLTGNLLGELRVLFGADCLV